VADRLDVVLEAEGRFHPRPVDNAHIESFNGRLRDGCLNSRWFESIDDARQTLQAWRCAGAVFTRLRRRAPGWTNPGAGLKLISSLAIQLNRSERGRPGEHSIKSSSHAAGPDATIDISDIKIFEPHPMHGVVGQAIQVRALWESPTSERWVPAPHPGHEATRIARRRERCRLARETMHRYEGGRGRVVDLSTRPFATRGSKP
jgi:hypothetical protein